MLTELINDYLKLLFIMTPFFVLSSFITMTVGMGETARRGIAVKVTIAVLLACFAMFFFGKYIFELFGITLDAFRIGAGSMLFLSAVSLVNGSRKVSVDSDNEDIAVVPLAIPITVGPGAIGVMMVMGAEPRETMSLLVFCIALTAAAFSIGGMLWSSNWLQRYLSPQSLSVMQKITGLFVAAIAAQIIFTGIRNFMLP